MVDDPIDIPETPYPTFDIDDVPELVQENRQYEQKQSIPPKCRIVCWEFVIFTVTIVI